MDDVERGRRRGGEGMKEAMGGNGHYARALFGIKNRPGYGGLRSLPSLSLSLVC